MKNTTEHLGRSMVEMIGVLSIAGVLSIGGIAGYATASHTMRTNKLKDEASTLIANIRSMYFTARDYEGLSETTLIAAGLVPQKMITEDRLRIQNKVQGRVFVSPAAYGYEPNGSFILVFNGLDAKTCRELAISDWGSDIASGFIALSIKNDGELTVENSKLTDAVVASDDNVILVRDIANGTLEQVYQLCDCGYKDTCAIAWKFY